MKKFKEFKKEVVEDAPVNNVGGGNIAGVGVGVDGEPGVKKKKKKSIVIGNLKRKITENNYDNNVILKQILDGIDKVEMAIDTKNKPVTSFFEENKPKKSIREKYQISNVRKKDI